MKDWNGISASSLKWIAIVTMLIDHFAIAIYLNLPGFDVDLYRCFRYIGRIAFPIYCFLLVEGFLRTHNVKKYIARMAGMALLSEMPFDMVRTGKYWDLSGQNVFFTLSSGLIVLYVIHRNAGFSEKKLCIQAITIVIGAVVANYGEFDYHYMGILTIVFFYYIRVFVSSKYRDIFGAVFLLFDIPASLAMIPIHFYNGKRGFSCKLFFYMVYPVHLLILGVLRMKFL